MIDAIALKIKYLANTLLKIEPLFNANIKANIIGIIALNIYKYVLYVRALLSRDEKYNIKPTKRTANIRKKVLLKSFIFNFIYNIRT
jgi:hypothetical protein